MASSAIPPAQYFTALAANYTRQTGDATRIIFLDTWGDIAEALPITGSSVVHDNAGGVGTATSVIVDKLPDAVPEVLITDKNPGMVAAARDAFREFPSITAEEMDSQELRLEDSRFSHSILNFSVFLFPEPVPALRAIHASLRPQGQGLAALLTWKRFGFADVIHAAQRLIRPDLPVLRLPGPQFYEEGVLARLAVEAGFPEDGMRVLQRKVVSTGEQLGGLKDFILAEFGKTATREWTDEERTKWPQAVEGALQREVEEHGGMLFEAWVVIAKT